MSGELEFYLVDAFAPAPYSGNVAGVVFGGDGLSDRQMQSIAAEFNASETTFVLRPTDPEADVQFRWFTPGCEVNFCGHATIGAVQALIEAGRYAELGVNPDEVLRVQTRSGVLAVRVQRTASRSANPTIWIDMPHCEPKSTKIVVQPIVQHLGISMDMLDLSIPPIRTFDEDVMIAVKSLQTLLEMQPAMSELSRYCKGERLRGVFVTTRNVLSQATVVQSRFFAPAAGIDEDPVTGSAHGPLGLHLVNSGIVPMRDGTAEFYCAQGKAGGRAGMIAVVVREVEGKRQVRVGGTCYTTAKGKLSVLPARA